VTCYHYVLEAKLVTRNGLCLSLASEWIENPEGNYRKQDCERKAFLRLASKLKKQVLIHSKFYSHNQQITIYL
jgi:hypothetical protein